MKFQSNFIFKISNVRTAQQKWNNCEYFLEKHFYTIWGMIVYLKLCESRLTTEIVKEKKMAQKCSGLQYWFLSDFLNSLANNFIIILLDWTNETSSDHQCCHYPLWSKRGRRQWKSSQGPNIQISLKKLLLYCIYFL